MAIANKPQKTTENLWKRLPSKGFLLACVLIIVIPLVLQANRRLMLSSLTQKKLLIIEGERPADSNFYETEGHIGKSRQYFGGQSLELDTPIRPDNAYFARYDFSIEEKGEYHFYLAGTPPGPSATGSEWSSPFYLSIDNAGPKLLTEEGLKVEWPYLFRFNYAKGGYYFTKVATERLSRGVHTASLYVNQGRIHDGHFTLYVDALIIVPINLKPETNVGKIPKNLFYEQE